MVAAFTDFGAKNVQELLSQTGGLTSCHLNCRQHAETVAEGLKRLVAASPAEQRKWRWDTPEDIPRKIPDKRRDELIEIMFHQGQADLGLMRRNRSVNKETGEPEDAKWLFHYKRELREVLVATGVNMEEYGEFLMALDMLLTQGVAIWDMAMDAFGIPHPNSAMALRCVLYDAPDADYAVGAQYHWDRNDGTIHFAESEAGLLIPTNEAYTPEQPEMTVLPHASDDLVHLFVSAKLTYLDPGRFKPVWHGGMSAAVGMNRWAIIGFYHRDDHEFLPKEFKGKSRDPVAKLVRESRTLIAAK